MSLILDHINGDATDNRLENLRIVCPNCNATLETHCGRNKPPGRRASVVCEHCGGRFRAQHPAQRFCSRTCAGL
ncbi:MAG TPA: HNH endonuclease, partial [Solirubrobacteraceae bacterium]